jgi:hypothetical protein
MKINYALTLLVCIAVISTACLCQAQILSKPTVTVPSGWKLDTDTAYPNAQSEFDPAGAGLLEYVTSDTNDDVAIYYEKAQVNYTNLELEDEAVRLFQRDFPNHDVTDSGVVQAAGVPAGYAKGYDETIDAYVLDMFFVKDNYCFNVIAIYGSTTQSADQVTSIIDSIGVGGGTFSLGGNMLYIIIGVIVAVIVIVAVVVVLRSRKKKTNQPLQISPGNYPPPPPPPQQ